MPSAPGERSRIVLLAGEAGVGKSRLVREFATGAEEGGALVLRGACDAVVRTPYGPFVEALDQLAGELDEAELRDAIGGGGELGRLLPDLAGLAGEPPSPERADPDTERHRLHMALAGLLANVARDRPAVLVLEDVHWADGPTLLLLRHLARSGADSRLLAIATFRETEPDRGGGARRRRSPTCAATTRSCGCGSRGSPAPRSPSCCAPRRGAGRAPSWASWRRRSTT